MTLARHNRRLTANAALAGAVFACLALIFFPPARLAVYPQCPIHEYFGVLCPGCGATHALAALLRGHLLEALRQNALFVLLLPFVLFGSIRAYIGAIRTCEFRWPRVSTPVLMALLIVTVAFTLARNANGLSF